MSPRTWYPDQVAVDLLARQMWIAVAQASGRDGVEAAESWDRDELLTDTYEEWEAQATVALLAERSNRAGEQADAVRDQGGNA